jgi:nicotinamidase-related amidase
MHKVHIPQWATNRGRALNGSHRIEPSRTALLVIDVQNGFITQGQPCFIRGASEILPNVNSLICAVRNAGGRVVFLRQTFSSVPPLSPAAWQMEVAPAILRARRAMVPGNFAHEVHGDLTIDARDEFIDKYRYSAFAKHSSELEEYLRTAEIHTTIVTGLATNCCCESTARDAFMLGFRVFFVSDATAAATDEEHNAALLSMSAIFANVLTTADLLTMLRSEV